MSDECPPLRGVEKETAIEAAYVESRLSGHSPEFAEAQRQGALHGICSHCGTAMEVRQIAFWLNVYCPHCTPEGMC